MPDKPNILWLMSDEHRPDVAGFAGDKVVRTPTLDRLAADGVVFDHAYTPSPICVPSRQCIAAGQFTTTCGVHRYGEDLPPFSMTLPRWLGDHGYHTVCCGKLHHMGPEQMQGWHRRVGMDHMLDNTRPASTRETGTAKKWTDGQEIRRAGLGRGTCHMFDEYALEGFKQIVNERLLDPDYDKARLDQPTLLMLSMTNPHYPYFADRQRFAWYLNRVEPYFDEVPLDHPWLGRTAFPEPGHRWVDIGEDGCVTHRDVRRATAAYYANIEKLDAQYAAALDALELAGQDLDDWLIIYTTDHGEMLGQHGIWEKQKFFDASVRVPLVMRWPNGGLKGGRRVSENVNLCDFFATFADAAGLGLPDPSDCVNGRPLDSRSLLPLARGESVAWDDTTVSHFAGTDTMVKRGTTKYQRYEREDCRDEPEVVFDESIDPTESRNLIDEPSLQGVIAELRAVAESKLAGTS